MLLRHGITAVLQKHHDCIMTYMPTATCVVQRLVAREAQQKLADDALLHSCPPSSLLQIPLWADNLAPSVPHQLQGTLCVPAQCSVRLLRRVFARAIQV
jgi:hypothetical protein